MKDKEQQEQESTSVVIGAPVMTVKISNEEESEDS